MTAGECIGFFVTVESVCRCRHSISFKIKFVLDMLFTCSSEDLKRQYHCYSYISALLLE